MSQLPRWVLPIITMVIALPAALSIQTLHERSIEDSAARLVLAEYKEHSDHQQLIEAEALEKREVSPAMAREIDEERRGVDLRLEQLQQLGVDEAQVASLRQIWSTAETAMDEELRLIRDGRLEQA